MKKGTAQVFLIVNSILWGSSYVWSKMLLSYLPRYSILFLCSLGGLIMTVIIFSRSLKPVSIKAALKCILISLVSVVSNIFFIQALQYTSSSNTAFIVQMSVIITPAVTAVLNRKLPSLRIIISAFAALAGLFILTIDFNAFQLNIGDLLAAGNALFFSIFLICQGKAAESIELAGFSLIYYLTNTLAFLLLVSIYEFTSLNIDTVIHPQFFILIAASIIVTVVTFLFQFFSLRRIQPEKAALIYTIEPVVAAMFAYFFIGESFRGWNAIIGCMIILTSVLFSVFTSRNTVIGRNKKLDAVFYVDSTKVRLKLLGTGWRHS